MGLSFTEFANHLCGRIQGSKCGKRGNWANALKDTNKMLDTEAHQKWRRQREEEALELCFAQCLWVGMIPFRALQAMHSAEAKARTVTSEVRLRRSSGRTGQMSAVSEDRRWWDASWTG